MKDYDPNKRDGKHVVEVTFQNFAFTHKATVSVNGNCKGFDVLEAAVRRAIEDIFDEFSEGKDMIFTLAGSNETLSVEPHDLDDDELCDLITKVRIVKFSKKKKKK